MAFERREMEPRESNTSHSCTWHDSMILSCNAAITSYGFNLFCRSCKLQVFLSLARESKITKNDD